MTAVDASAGHLAAVGANFPDAVTEKHDLQELPYRDRFDGVLCVDAMEFVPPEDWPRLLERFRVALHGTGQGVAVRVADVETVAGHSNDVRVLRARVEEAEPEALALADAERWRRRVGLPVDGHDVVGGRAAPTHRRAHATAAHHAPHAAAHHAHHPAP